MSGGLNFVESGTTETVKKALHAFLVPQHVEATAVEQALLKQGDVHHIASDGMNIQAWSWKPVSSNRRIRKVLLVHGWNSRGSHLGEFVLPLLHLGMEVWTFDAHAHGSSTGVYSSVTHHARSILHVAKAMQHVDGVVAHSVGSPATILACNWGLSPSASIHLAGPSSLRRVAIVAGRMTGVSDLEMNEYLAGIETVARLPLADVEVSLTAKKLTHAGLLFHDPQDKEVPFKDSMELVACWPHSELRAVSNLGHRRILKDPQVIEETVTFLNSAFEKEVQLGSEAA